MYPARVLVTCLFLFGLAACGAGRTGRIFSDEYITLSYRPQADEPQPGSVYLSGSFNDWLIADPAFRCLWDPLEQYFSIGFNLEPGRYEYRFVVDGRWVLDPDARESAPDPLGGRLGVFYVTKAIGQ